MNRWQRIGLSLFLLLGATAPARANWFSDVMCPYPTYGHPSFYFPPAMAAFYAGYGYESLIPGVPYYYDADPAHAAMTAPLAGHAAWQAPAAPYAAPLAGYGPPAPWAWGTPGGAPGTLTSR